MSYTELHIGKMKPTNLTLKEVVNEYLEHNELPSYLHEPLDDEDLMEIFRNYTNYLMFDDQIYELIDKKFDEEYDIYQMTKNKDGTFDYIVKFYNGGCGFEEAIEEAFKKKK